MTRHSIPLGTRLCLIGIFGLVHHTVHAATPTFKRDIFPILKTNCIKCHGPKKQKGKIRLDSPDHIRRAAIEHKIIVPGDPEKSSFYKLTVLHKDDEDRMPPKGEPLTKAQTTRLWEWVTQGANLGDKKPFFAKVEVEKSRAITATGPSRQTVNADIIAALAPYRVIVTAYGHQGLGVSYRYIKPANFADAFKRTLPFKDNIWHVDLSRHALTPDTLSALATWKKLGRLDLRSTTLTGATLAPLANAQQLHWLNLVDSSLSDDVGPALQAIKPLKTIYLPIFKTDDDSLEKQRSLLKGRVAN